ncbi:oxidoreductase [Penicillium diatomitis]|uniref:D-xylose reductase [NAD(P)H] n=1 Tax=Penicillium diatomitis TaxID=2819901 RepID=A0A9W9XEE5_9EURO|nr:oxidoreductase [Penicillium diatomitis]KAJ5489513.1 oxidoreductase [Penicillium diatomitis]
MPFEGLKTFKLNTGAEIPALGLGTWQDADAQESAVREALKAGYRHIDTARCYGTEGSVGKGIKASGVPRDQIFVTTKLWNNKHHPDDVGPALQDSLNDLGIEYIDLFLMHWPVAFKRGDEMFPKDKDGDTVTDDIDYVDTYKAMEKLLKTGKVKAIGISNFAKKEVERLIQSTEVVPAVHQMECHPWLQQKTFMDYHKEKGIHVTQYSPFGNQNEIYKAQEKHGKLVDDKTLIEIGKKYGKSSNQVALAWGIAHGRSVIPKSKSPERIAQNFQGVFDLDQADIEAIDKIDKKLRFNDSSDSFGYNFFTDLDGKEN